MKKVIIAFAALAIFAACNKSEVVDVDRQAISFGGAFIDNATKSAVDGSYSGTTDKKLTKFQVYGTVTVNEKTLTLFNGNEVTGEIGDEEWTCAGEEHYWAQNAEYLFYAIADATSVSPTTGMPTTITYDEKETPNGDLLFAVVEDETNEAATPSKGNPVKFTFTHLLSKAKFTFKKAAYNNERYTFTVKNIKFVDAYTEGVYTINDGTWADQANTDELSFGDLDGTFSAKEGIYVLESAKERQFVPATYTSEDPLTISFDVVMMLDGVEISSITKTHKFPAGEQEPFTFAKNTAYNFGVELADNNKITFTVEALDTWVDADEIDIP